MKLNEQSKNELRKEIEEAVKRVPEGQRIELPLDLLDDLIFLKIKDKKGVTVKFPIWTGEFLRKIDLSEISFENVFMSDIVLPAYVDIDSTNFSDFIDKNYGYRLPFVHLISPYDMSRLYDIDFSYTNINIDFSKLYSKLISGVNLEGVDLSNSHIMDDKNIDSSNFSNTNITSLPPLLYNGTSNCRDCVFSNNDLSKININLSDFLLSYYDYDPVFPCMPNFTNTGISFEYDLINNIRNNYFIKMLKMGYLDGCFINEILIENFKSLNDEQVVMKLETIIEKQNKHFGLK